MQEMIAEVLMVISVTTSEFEKQQTTKIKMHSQERQDYFSSPKMEIFEFLHFDYMNKTFRIPTNKLLNCFRLKHNCLKWTSKFIHSQNRTNNIYRKYLYNLFELFTSKLFIHYSNSLENLHNTKYQTKIFKNNIF